MSDENNTVQRAGPQQQNCAWEICCDTPEAIASLAQDLRARGCTTIEAALTELFEYHTLAPRSFLKVKRDIAAAALAGRLG